MGWLLITIADPAAAPADELAALCAQRWEIESAFDELKTHQRGPKVVLRSKTPAGVRQEAYGYLCVHYAIRALMHAATTTRASIPTGSPPPVRCAPPGAACAPRPAPPRSTSPVP